jgi:excisionase family DNA binding protein
MVRMETTTKSDVLATHGDDFTVPELARLLKLSPATIRKMLVWREITPAWKLGREWRIPASTVDKLYYPVTQTPLG